MNTERVSQYLLGIAVVLGIFLAVLLVQEAGVWKTQKDDILSPNDAILNDTRDATATPDLVIPNGVWFDAEGIRFQYPEGYRVHVLRGEENGKRKVAVTVYDVDNTGMSIGPPELVITAFPDDQEAVFTLWEGILWEYTDAVRASFSFTAASTNDEEHI